MEETRLRPVHARKRCLILILALTIRINICVVGFTCYGLFVLTALHAYMHTGLYVFPCSSRAEFPNK